MGHFFYSPASLPEGTEGSPQNSPTSKAVNQDQLSSTKVLLFCVFLLNVFDIKKNHMISLDVHTQGDWTMLELMFSSRCWDCLVRGLTPGLHPGELRTICNSCDRGRATKGGRLWKQVFLDMLIFKRVILDIYNFVRWDMFGLLYTIYMS